MAAIEQLGMTVSHFREPGGTRIGEAIRAITHDPANTMLDYRAEALLLAACRAQLVSDVYKPLLAEKQVVIADRYVDSSYVYQGIARGLGYEAIKELNDFVIDGLLPDITFLLDLDYREGQKRRLTTTKLDRFDTEQTEFHRTVQLAYLDLAKKFPARIIIIDASQSIQAMQQLILKHVLDYIETQAGNIINPASARIMT